jgi:ferritin-like metal-binding protein YciE
MTNLRAALVDEIRDLYSAEKQLTKTLPKLSKVATNERLCDAFGAHLEETQNHVTRLERVFELLDEKPRAKHCAGMAGIIEEASDKFDGEYEDAALDARLIAAAQKAEHYEIGAYGTAIAWAKALELNDVATVLGETLTEEKAADQKLSSLAESGINDAASAGDAAEMDEDETETRARKQEPAPTVAKATRARGARH